MSRPARRLVSGSIWPECECANSARAGERECNDDLDPLRESRPDRVRPDDPGDPTVLSRKKERLMLMIDDTHTVTEFVMPTSIPGPRTTKAVPLEYLVRVFQFTENREARMEPDEDKGWGMLAGCTRTAW